MAILSLMVPLGSRKIDTRKSLVAIKAVAIRGVSREMKQGELVHVFFVFSVFSVFPAIFIYYASPWISLPVPKAASIIRKFRLPLTLAFFCGVITLIVICDVPAGPVVRGLGGSNVVLVLLQSFRSFEDVLEKGFSGIHRDSCQYQFNFTFFCAYFGYMMVFWWFEVGMCHLEGKLKYWFVDIMPLLLGLYNAGYFAKIYEPEEER
ncbi:hypothetical protein QBC38DRAFT_478484 [Podospora fimiseda]|uniref:Uncharacterized protein n=1 Tax=Podospora fimiseda TaxID=252190 RepID=A0AAN7GYL5_9PEZI|nr:hypothetical protein QBC38DRAFT_478484 [Podospora fimiseda]